MKINTILKNSLLVTFFLISTISFSQERVVNLGDFTVLKVFNGLTLELIRSDEQKIVITGEKKENLTIKTANGRLKVFLKFPELYDNKEVSVKLYYKEDIAVLDVNEGAAIFSDETFKQQNATIKSQEGAYVHLVLDVDFLIVKAISGGNIRLRGTVKNQEVEVTSGGVYDGYELISTNSEVLSASGGKVEVNVTSFLDASVRFGGIIEYKGSPEKVKTKKIIGGKIINKG